MKKLKNDLKCLRQLGSQVRNVICVPLQVLIFKMISFASKKIILEIK